MATLNSHTKGQGCTQSVEAPSELLEHHVRCVGWIMCTCAMGRAAPGTFHQEIPPRRGMSSRYGKSRSCTPKVDVKNCCLVEDHTGFVTRLDELHRRHMPLDTPQAAVLAASPGPLGSLHVNRQPAPRRVGRSPPEYISGGKPLRQHLSAGCKALEMQAWLASAQQALRQLATTGIQQSSPPRIASILLRNCPQQSHTLGCYKLTLGYRNKTLLIPGIQTITTYQVMHQAPMK
jgi:hypothetical protein